MGCGLLFPTLAWCCAPWWCELAALSNGLRRCSEGNDARGSALPTQAAAVLMSTSVKLSNGETAFVTENGVDRLPGLYEAWRGVDLYNIAVRQHSYQAIADNAQVVHAWLNTSAGKRVMSLVPNGYTH